MSDDNDDDMPDMVVNLSATIDIEFGDADPEDAYSTEDPEDERLDVLERVVEHLRTHRDERFEMRRLDALQAVEAMSEVIEERIHQRVEEIRGALEEMR